MSRQPSDVIAEFLTVDPARRLRLADEPGAREPLRALLGEDGFRELQALARSAREPGHLATRPVDLIFLPGVMGSVLASQGQGGIWWIDPRTRHRLDDLRLSPDGTTDEDEGFQVGPVVVDPGYDAFFTATRGRSDLGYQGFPYDWRKPIAADAARLRDAVLAAHAANGGRPVHLVAHSMGGLVVRTTLGRYPELWRQVGKVVFLATPHYGSPAIAGYLKNHFWGFSWFAVLGKYLSRRTFRSMWGVLALLPAPVGVYPGTRDDDPKPAEGGDRYPHPCANFDLYDAHSWRLDGLTAEQEDRLQTVLSAAGAAHRELHAWHEQLDQGKRDRMAVIAGVGYRTLFRVAFRRRLDPGLPSSVDFGWETMERVTKRIPGDRDREGDGRVPLASAELEHVGEVRYVRAVHGGLPNERQVTDDVFRFLADEPMQLPRSAKAALHGHLGTHATSDGGGDDPGYLDLEPPSDGEVAKAEEALADGRLPAFDQLRIL
ncbi:lipase family alpha/beta hydrolase [Kitasatospora sp. NPDC059722]|uniref:lipase family alpha/beta hydrolase n=1 Tax=unclassified Kitasatospora TaxID=2633591 RepID=UPI0036576CFB